MSMWQGRRVEEVDAADVAGGTEAVVLLDVRNANEWEAGHAPSATWVPLGELEGARFTLPMNRRIVCVCRSGQRSQRAAAELMNMGFNAVNLTGGMKAWVAQGLPVVRDDGTDGEVI
jgi:rhodanese-related sulfurtransferase